MPRLSTHLSLVSAFFLMTGGVVRAQAAEGRDVPPLVAPGGKAIGADDGAVGAGDGTMNPLDPMAPIPMTLNRSSEVWTTFKGDWQRSGASSAKVNLPLSLLWRHSTDAAPGLITSSPLVTGPPGARKVFFAAARSIFCIDAQDGTQRWSSDLKGTVRAPLTLLSGGDGGDTILAVTMGGQIAALSASDGAVRWQIETRTPFNSVAPVIANTAGGPRILLGDINGNIVAYDSTGQPDPAFSVKLGKTRTAAASTPIVNAAGDRLYVVARDQKLYSINTKDGTIEYESLLRVTSLTTPALIGDTLIITADNRVIGVYADGGQQKWQTKLTEPGGGAERIAASPAGSGDVAYVGTLRKNLYAINTQDGDVRWKTALGSSVSGTPLVLPNAVVVGTRNGMLFALKPEDGTILWRYRLHSDRLVSIAAPATAAQPVVAQPVVPNQPPPPPPPPPKPITELRTFPISSALAAVDGALYVVADNAALYALSESAFDAESPRAVAAMFLSGKTPYAYSGERPIIVSGKAPISFLLTLVDQGSGIDADKFKVTLDNEEVAPEDIEWSPGTGRLSVKISKPDKNGKTAVLADGAYKVNVVARDYKGNVVPFGAIFNVDQGVNPPASTRKRTTPATR